MRSLLPQINESGYDLPVVEVSQIICIDRVWKMLHDEVAPVGILLPDLHLGTVYVPDFPCNIFDQHGTLKATPLFATPHFQPLTTMPQGIAHQAVQERGGIQNDSVHGQRRVPCLEGVHADRERDVAAREEGGERVEGGQARLGANLWVWGLGFRVQGAG